MYNTKSTVNNILNRDIYSHNDVVSDALARGAQQQRQQQVQQQTQPSTPILTSQQIQQLRTNPNVSDVNIINNKVSLVRPQNQQPQQRVIPQQTAQQIQFKQPVQPVQVDRVQQPRGWSNVANTFKAIGQYPVLQDRNIGQDITKGLASPIGQNIIKGASRAIDYIQGNPRLYASNLAIQEQKTKDFNKKSADIINADTAQKFNDMKNIWERTGDIKQVQTYAISRGIQENQPKGTNVYSNKDEYYTQKTMGAIGQKLTPIQKQEFKQGMQYFRDKYSYNVTPQVRFDPTGSTLNAQAANLPLTKEKPVYGFIMGRSTTNAGHGYPFGPANPVVTSPNQTALREYVKLAGYNYDTGELRGKI